MGRFNKWWNNLGVGLLLLSGVIIFIELTKWIDESLR